MIKLGIERLDEYKDLFSEKRIGLITNPSGFSSIYKKSSIDLLKEKYNLVSLFSPEHGVRANIQAGEKLQTYIDEQTGCMVYSLYGSTKKPTKEMMDSIDIMCIDIQDVGSRFYTFIYTMAYAMMACKEYNKKFIVFDRPNPINGIEVEGNILDITYRSFVGYYPIVQRHGLTIGEVAYLFNNEFGINCDLEIIKMVNYDRSKYLDELGLMFIAPSPNVPTLDSLILYNGTCIFEGTNVSEGRGTTRPFSICGAPWINPLELANKLNSMNLEGVYFRETYYTPTFAKYANEMCGGVELHITDREKIKAVKLGWTMLQVIRDMYKDDFKISKPYKEGMHNMLEFNTGSSYIPNNVYSLEEQYQILENDTKEFIKIRKQYLLY